MKGCEVLNLFNLYAEIGLKADKFNVKAHEVANKGEKLKEKFGELKGKVDKVSAVLATVAGSAVIAYGKKAIGLASDLQEVQNVVDVTFGANNKLINQWAKEAPRAVGMSELAFKKSTGTMGAMLKSMQLSEDQVLNMSKSLVHLSGDFASFYNLEHEEAFEKIRSGISGETEPLKQLGINMSVANLEAHALAEGIKKPYNQMTQSEQALLRYSYLMNASKDAQGDFARTTDSFANQLRIFKLESEQATTAIGEKLLPAVTKMLTYFNENKDTILDVAQGLAMGGAIFALNRGITKIVEKLLTLEKRLNLVTVAKKAFDIIMKAKNLPEMAKGMVGLAKSIIMATKAQKGLNLAMKANIIGMIITGIMALVAGFIYLWNTSESFRNFWIGLWNNVKAVCQPVFDFLSNFFTSTLPAIWEDVKQMFTDFPGWLAEKWEMMKDLTSKAWEGLKSITSKAWGGLKGLIGKAWDGIKSFCMTKVPEIIDGIIMWFKSLPDRIWNVLVLVVNKFKEWGRNILEYIVTNAPIWIEKISYYFKNLPAIIGYILSFAFHKIIKWGMDILSWIITNVPNWITSIANFFMELPGKIWEWLTVAFTKLGEWGVLIWNKAIEIGGIFLTNLINWFMQLPSKIWEWLTIAMNTIAEWGPIVWAKAVEIGTNFLTKLINFFIQLPGKIWNWLTKALSKIGEWGPIVWAKAIEIGSNFLTKLIDWFMKLPGRIWEWLVNAKDKVAEWGPILADKAMQAGKDLVKALIDEVKSLPGKLFNLGADIVKGLWNGIISVKDWFKGKISNFFSGVVAGAKDAMDIHSPSRVMRDEVGKWMAKGVGVGFVDEMDNVQADVQHSLQAGVDATFSQTRVKAKAKQDNILVSIYKVLELILQKDVVLTTEDGRELAKMMARHKDEFDKYDLNNNINFLF